MRPAIQPLASARAKDAPDGLYPPHRPSSRRARAADHARAWGEEVAMLVNSESLCRHAPP
jgi:hypothetical protein